MRNLTWGDCFNVRDLGGLTTRSGSPTRFKSFVRADSLDRLTESGVYAMREYGVRTIIDMRDARERNSELAYDGIERLHVPLEDQSDEGFWQEWRPYNSTPIYYESFLGHCPERVRQVFESIATAPTGGIVFHCGSGRDRTGLISILLLSLVGVRPEDIVADYCLSEPNLKPLGQIKDQQAIENAFATKRTDAKTVIVGLLQNLDVEAYLEDAGFRHSYVDAIKDRLV